MILSIWGELKVIVIKIKSLILDVLHNIFRVLMVTNVT